MPRRADRKETCEQRQERLRLAHNEAQRRYYAKIKKAEGKFARQARRADAKMVQAVRKIEAKAPPKPKAKPRPVPAAKPVKKKPRPTGKVRDNLIERMVEKYKDLREKDWGYIHRRVKADPAVAAREGADMLATRIADIIEQYEPL